MRLGARASSATPIAARASSPATRAARRFAPRARATRDVEGDTNRQRDADDARRGAVAWFRDHDLRVSDNAALLAAVETARRRGGETACVFAWDETRDGETTRGARRAWLVEALDALDRELRRRYGGGGLSYYRGTHAEAMRAACGGVGATRAFASRRYEPTADADDEETAASVRDACEIVRLPGYLLFEPEKIQIDLRREKYFFGTLMPFVHAAEKLGGKVGAPRAAPASARVVDLGPEHGFAASLEELGIVSDVDKRLDWAAGIRAEWTMSESGAASTWEHFASVGLEKFEDDHGRADIVAPAAVSTLSPYLRHGQISPRQIYHELATKKMGSDGVEGKKLSRVFWHRLYRREFAYWQLHNWPELPSKSVRGHYENRKAWLEGDEAAVALHRWQTGTTGFPTVDAGMRRLWATGWMHQSERMIAATFLVDYCGVHWTHGADWFLDTLVDADLAINSMMWQNAGKSGLDQWDVFAGSLTPDGSSRAHDPEGESIARWIPELAALPKGHLRHRPWEASAKQLDAAGVELGSTYPTRMITDLEGARRRMLDDVNALRVDEINKAATRANAASAADVDARSSDVFVDVRSASDFVVAPPGATKDHAGALVPVSTRKEFKTELKSTKGAQAAMQSAYAWADRALAVAETAASADAAKAKAQKRAQRAHGHSHAASTDASRVHAHAHGHSHAPSRAPARRSSAWQRPSRASARALSDARADRADRRVVKSLRREAREINAAHAGRRPAAADDDDDDA